METPTNLNEEAARLEGCLASLTEQLAVLDQLGISIAAIKVSEACYLIENEITSRHQVSRFG